VAPEDHPWRAGNGFTEIRKHANKPSEHVDALQDSCDFHLGVSASEGTDVANKKYCVAHIHWPVAINKIRKQRGRLISANMAKQFDICAGYTGRFFDDRNKVGKLYVQAPVCPQAEVRAEIQSMTSLRAKRTEETRVRQEKMEEAKRVRSEEMMRVMKSDAVVRLQSAWRSSLIRMRVKSHAALLLQSAWRSSLIRMRVKSRAVVRLQSAWRASMIRLRVKSRAVVRLQSAWRASVIRLRVKSHAALLLQSAWRSYVARSDLEGMRPKSPTVIDPQSPDLFPSLETITKYLGGKFQIFGSDQQKFRNHQRSWGFLNHLNYTLKEPSIRLMPKTVLVLCSNYGRDGCLCFSIRSVDNRTKTPCDNCIKELKKCQRKARKKRSNIEAGLDHANPSSKANVTSLTPVTKTNRLRNTLRRSNSLKKRVGRLVLKLEQSISFSVEEEDNVMEVLEHALKYCTANAGEMRKRILAVLVESVKGYSVDDNDESRQAEIEAYVQAFSTTISNYALSVSGKKGVVRFDSRVLRSALGFWLESPAAYERLRENSLEVYPSQTTLYNLQRKLIPNEGHDPRVYGWFGDNRRTGGNSQYSFSS
jgi:hypothetical protein